MKILDVRSIPVEIAEEVEQWIQTQPKMGDHIKVNRGLYTHHGIFITPQEIIHFTGENDDNVLDWSKNKVITTDIDRFLLEGVLECKKYTDEEMEDLYPVDHIVAYARACLGDDGYNLIFNNCEHFANVCTLGRFSSPQIERIFKLIFPIERRGSMGLREIFSNIFGSRRNGGSRSTSSTTYEPDKVKIAEIEQETQIRLANTDLRKIELMKEARLELLEKEFYLKEALIEANARSLSFIAQTIVAIQTQLNEITEKRIEIIERGSLSVIKEIEDFYNQLQDKISLDNDEYNQKRLPVLLETLNQFERSSPAFKLYEKRIDDDMSQHAESIRRQLENLSSRQNLILNGLLTSKERIIEQNSQITASLLEQIEHIQIDENNQQKLTTSMKDNKELPQTKALTMN